ncbi:hypothetical protein EV361DRAFT_887891 [Lentinula raphanica]|nr:hypothetical protein EV361DRAFT_887891 [Lentinula raphanica]
MEERGRRPSVILLRLLTHCFLVSSFPSHCRSVVSSSRRSVVLSHLSLHCHGRFAAGLCLVVSRCLIISWPRRFVVLQFILPLRGLGLLQCGSLASLLQPSHCCKLESSLISSSPHRLCLLVVLVCRGRGGLSSSLVVSILRCVCPPVSSLVWKIQEAEGKGKGDGKREVERDGKGKRGKGGEPREGEGEGRGNSQLGNG